MDEFDKAKLYSVNGQFLFSRRLHARSKVISRRIARRRLKVRLLKESKED